MPADRFAGRVAVVTGAGRGIGQATAIRLAGEGAYVVLVDRAADRLHATANALSQRGYPVRPEVVDVADRAAVQALVAHLHAHGHHIDVLINSAGVHQIKHWLELEPIDWERLFRINALGVLSCMQSVAPAMRERGYGRIVNLASVAARLGDGNSMHYAASKAAVISMTRSAAVDLARYGVTVNAVCPGYVDDEFTAEVSQELEVLGIISHADRQQQALARIPLGRAATADEVARAVVFLASDDAAYMTGQAVDVNGGWIMP